MKNKPYSNKELKALLAKINEPHVSELQGETIKQRLYALHKFLNRRYNVNFGLMEEKHCGASSSFKGCSADNPPVPPKTITFNFRGKYAISIKRAVEVFLHEYAHLLLVTLGFRDYEQYCNQFADLLLKEIEVACPEFLYGDVDVNKETDEQYAHARPSKKKATNQKKKTTKGFEHSIEVTTSTGEKIF